jgi:4'-phosphopantetheinyl transferase
MASDVRTRAVASSQQMDERVRHLQGRVKVVLDHSIEVVVARLADEGEGEGGGSPAIALSDDERQRARRFAFDRDRRRFVVARARLRKELGSRLGVLPAAVELQYGAHGKPALAGRFAEAELRFNVSHCDDVVVYAFAAGREVGIDVEAIRALPDADAIAARFFSSRENIAYRALHPRDRPLGFFQCWTRKEAFIKALGEGLSHPLDSFDVSLAPGEPAELLRVGPVPGDDRTWRLESLSPAPGYVAALVGEER